jgi:hypothetical protein
MPTRTFPVSKSARVGTDGSLDLGAGACDHLPVGSGGGYEYRSLLAFTHNWTDMVNITSIVLRIRNTSTYHIARGGSSGTRTIRIQGVTESWNQGSASHPMTTGNAVVWPGPSRTSTGEVTSTTSGSDNAWNEIDVTDLYDRFVPAYIDVNGTPGSAQSNYGIAIIADDSGDTAEFWSDNKAGSEPEIVVTYTTNTEPTIVITAPAASSEITFEIDNEELLVTATLDDDDGDSITKVEAIFGYENGINTRQIEFEDAVGISGYAFSRTYDLSAPTFNDLLYEGALLWVQMRCYDGTAWSDYVYRSWTVHLEGATDPVITGTAATVMEMTVEGTSTTPQAVVRWTYSDPAGLAQSRYIAKLQSSGGGTTYETLDVSNANSYAVFTYTGLVHGTSYRFAVTTYNSDGIASNEVVQVRVAKWATAIEYYNVGSVTQWSTETDTTVATDTRCVVQHGSSAGSGTTPTNWNTSLSSIALNTYYWSRYWLFAWNGAATSGVSMNLHEITYTSTALTPDGWTLFNGASVDTSDYWYGTRSLKLDASGTNPTALSSDITLKVGETYVLSGRVKSVGNSDARIAVRRKVAGTWIVNNANTGGSGFITATTDGFVEIQTPPFVADTETVQIQCWIIDTASTIAWFDALKLEVGSVVTAWTPSVIGRAVIVDGNGVQIDGRGGGVFRLRGTDTAVTNSEVTVTDEGMRFDSPLTLKEISAPGTPDAGYVRLYANSDATPLLAMKDDAGNVTTFNNKAPTMTVHTATASNQAVPTGAKAFHVRVQGGGGGGGGAATTIAGQGSEGGGGGAGGYAEKLYTVVSGTYTATVGGAANGGTAGANDGTAGNNSTFLYNSVTVTANGGGAGTGCAASSGGVISDGGNGGTASTGDLNVTGGDGHQGRIISGNANVQAHGGASFYGGGSRADTATSRNAASYGAGGAGAVCAASTSARAGGNGAQGVIVITWYY